MAPVRTKTAMDSPSLAVSPVRTRKKVPVWLAGAELGGGNVPLPDDAGGATLFVALCCADATAAASAVAASQRLCSNMEGGAEMHS